MGVLEASKGAVQLPADSQKQKETIHSLSRPAYDQHANVPDTCNQ